MKKFWLVFEATNDIFHVKKLLNPTLTLFSSSKMGSNTTTASLFSGWRKIFFRFLISRGKWQRMRLGCHLSLFWRHINLSLFDWHFWSNNWRLDEWEPQIIVIFFVLFLAFAFGRCVYRCCIWKTIFCINPSRKHQRLRHFSWVLRSCCCWEAGN